MSGDLPVAPPTAHDARVEDTTAARVHELATRRAGIVTGRLAFRDCMYVQWKMRQGDRADAAQMLDVELSRPRWGALAKPGATRAAFGLNEPEFLALLKAAP